MLLDGFSAKLRSETVHFWLDALGDIWMHPSSILRATFVCSGIARSRTSFYRISHG